MAAQKVMVSAPPAVPQLIPGGISIDDRGDVSFINDFDFSEVKRFYVVKNHKAEFVRAWHGHKHESKWLVMLAGTAMAGIVKLEGNLHSPDKNIKPETFIVSAQKPAALYIPAGYANGLRTLTDDCIAVYFSNKALGESGGDDYRYNYAYWGKEVWEVIPR